MRAIANFTFKSLRANRVRTFVTIAGVVLAAALLTAVMTSYTSLNGFLYDSERATSGSWMAKVHTEKATTAQAQIAGIRTDPSIDGIATITDIGFGELSAQQKNVLGQYLPVASYTGDIEELCAIQLTSGRLPTSPSEILLPDIWASRGYAQIGSAIEVNIGQRIVVAPEGQEVGMGTADLGYETTKGESTFTAGDRLDSTMGYFSGPDADEEYGEELIDTVPRFFTVVGFYPPYTYALSTGVGSMGLIGTSLEEEDAPTSTYLSFTGIGTADQLEALVQGHFPRNDGITYHSSLLRYLGIRGSSSIWNTFFGVAAVLALVIVVACISLIYNAFAISVAERAGQFGLLASIGASKKQLRRSVFIEGLIVALIGIPLGLLLGIGGCAVTFAFIGPMITETLGSPDVAFTVHVASWALIFSALLTLATVLVSVFIPALRAGRLSPIDAIRQNRSGEVSSRGLKAAKNATNPAKLWKTQGALSRFFGIGGILARINAKRSRAKGRAASLSLALAIVMLMTAGSFNLFIGNLVSAANASSSYDIGVTLQLEEDRALTPETYAYYQGAYEAMAGAPGAEGQGWFLGNRGALIMERTMVSDDFTDRDANSGDAGLRQDGTWGAYGNIYYMDDALFDEYARDHGIDPAPYHDAQNPQVIAIDRTYAFLDGKYQIIHTFDATGDIQMLDRGLYGDSEIVGYTSYAWLEDDEAERFEFIPIFDSEEGEDYRDSGEVARSGLDLDALPKTTVRIGALMEEPPDIISQHTETMQLIAPVSAALTESVPSQHLLYTAAFDAIEVPHGEVAESIDQAFTRRPTRRPRNTARPTRWPPAKTRLSAIFRTVLTWPSPRTRTMCTSARTTLSTEPSSRSCPTPRARRWWQMCPPVSCPSRWM